MRAPELPPRHSLSSGITWCNGCAQVTWTGRQMRGATEAARAQLPSKHQNSMQHVHGRSWAASRLPCAQGLPAHTSLGTLVSSISCVATMKLAPNNLACREPSGPANQHPSSKPHFRMLMCMGDWNHLKSCS